MRASGAVLLLLRHGLLRHALSQHRAEGRWHPGRPQGHAALPEEPAAASRVLRGATEHRGPKVKSFSKTIYIYIYIGYRYIMVYIQVI